MEINKTEWDIPVRYKQLSAVGSGAYGQVWYGFFFSDLLFVVQNIFDYLKTDNK